MQIRALLFVAALAAIAPAAYAENLFNGNDWTAVATDQRATHVGDILTVIVYQNAEARNAAQNVARRRHSFEGAVRSGSIDEGAELLLDGAYTGQGEVRRSESFVTQISTVIDEVLPNGDLRISGQQHMNVNGEETTVRVRGRVRPVDISSDNQVLSSRISDAEISYDGRGFVSRNAKPGIIQRVFSLLGLGG